MSQKEKKRISLSSIEEDYIVRGKKPNIPLYWKLEKHPSTNYPTYFYKEFIENFSERDNFMYDFDRKAIKRLVERYFGNYLSKKELSIGINRSISFDLNKIMRLLDEQPFPVFPMAGAPAIYYILPELQWIHDELKRNNISSNLKKKSSVLDIPIASINGFHNDLPELDSEFSFNSKKYLKDNSKKRKKLFRFRNFSVDEFSLSCYSKMSQYFLFGIGKEDKKNINIKFARKISFWNFLNSIFLIDNKALNWNGEIPSFEKEILKDEYQPNTFTHLRMFWEREYETSKISNSSVRELNRKKVKL